MERSLRVALLGAGGRGRAVLQTWVEQTGCEVTAIVDPSIDSINRARRQLGDRVANAESVTDVAGWYGRANCDLVLINSWDPQHAENCIACFEAGLNVFVAKPMTQTNAQGDAVYRAWRASGAVGVVDMQLRHCLLVEKTMSLIAEGAIGRVRLIQCMDYVGRGGVEFRSTRSRRSDMIHSWTLAKGVHFLDLLNLFAGSDPVRVYASGGRDVFGGDKPNDLRCSDCSERKTCFWEGSRIAIHGIPYGNPNAGCVFSQEADVNDNVVATIDYANGVRASYIDCYFTPEYQTIYDIVGDRGALTVRYGMDNRLYLILRPIGLAEQQRFDFYPAEQGGGGHGGGDVRIVKHLAAALRQGNAHTIQPDIRAGRQAVALCLAIDESAELGQPVTVPPVPEVASVTAPTGA